MTNPTWTVIIDPSAAIEGRTELNLNNEAIQITQEGINWGDAQVKPYLAEQQWGETPVSYRVPNRLVTIPLGLGMNHPGQEEVGARVLLQEKVAQLQREGGVLYRQRNSTFAGSAAMYMDIVGATLTLPDQWGETAEVESNVILQLECLPDFFGKTTELAEVTGAGRISSVLKVGVAEAVIAGDYPGRATIQLHNTGSHNIRGLIYGFRCRNYSSASTAALCISAYHMTPINGAKQETDGGAYEGHCVILESPPKESWVPMLSTDLSGTGPLTHVGSYQVWARVSVGASAPTRFRLAWSLDDATAPTYNTAAFAVGKGGEWEMLNLGQVNIEKAPVGEHWWRGVVQVEVNSGEVVGILVDSLEFQPLDECAGVLRAAASASPVSLTRTSKPGTSENDTGLLPGTSWTSPASLGEGHELTHLKTSGEEFGCAYIAKNLGLGLASGDTIHGIEVSLTYALLIEEIYHPYGEFNIELFGGRGLSGAGYSQQLNAGTSGTLTFGGPTALWGTTWTYTQLNETATGIAILEARTFGNTLYIEKASFTVYYTKYETELVEDAVVYESREASLRWTGCWREDSGSGGYARVSSEQGSLPRIPPSGIEGKPVQMYVRVSRGTLEEGQGDPNINNFAATVSYAGTFSGRL